MSRPSRTRASAFAQGGLLSPLLANLLLDDLDKILEVRDHRFCRGAYPRADRRPDPWADDVTIYVRSEKAGERVMASFAEFLRSRLHLQVNRDKSAVAPVGERKFLGHRLLRTGPWASRPRA